MLINYLLKINMFNREKFNRNVDIISFLLAKAIVITVIYLLMKGG